MKIKESSPHLLSVAAALILWQIAAAAIGSPLILPKPTAVFRCLITMCGEPAFWRDEAYTFVRVAKAFSITAAAGTALGIASGLSRPVRKFLEFPVSLLRSTPVVSLILIIVFMAESSSVPVAVAALMSVPVMFSAISSGFTESEEDRKMMQMARVFRLTRWQRMKFIWIPKLRPFASAGLVASFGMSWKVVVAGEVLSLPKHAVGTRLSSAQVHLESQEVMAISLLIIAISFAMEKILKWSLSEKK